MYTIMVIDDDESIGNMEQEMLEREGYQVQRAFSGTEALLLLKQKRPNLILLDLMLPGMSGEKVLSQIHEIPIIVVSAKTDADSKVNLLLGRKTRMKKTALITGHPADWDWNLQEYMQRMATIW